MNRFHLAQVSYSLSSYILEEQVPVPSRMGYAFVVKPLEKTEQDLAHSQSSKIQCLHFKMQLNKNVIHARVNFDVFG